MCPIVRKFAFAVVFTTASAGLMSCSTGIPVNEIPLTSDPTQEITRVNDGLVQASKNQGAVLAPESFKAASSNLEEAKEMQSKNKDVKDVLHQVSVAQAYLDRTTRAIESSNQLIPGVVKTRGDAVNAGAFQYERDDLAKTDSDLQEITRGIEKNDVSDVEQNRGKFEARYSDLELKALKKRHLGVARANIEKAKEQGAKKFTPQTLSWAEQKLIAAESSIIANRHDDAIITQSSTDALAASNRLNTMLTDAKSASKKNPEQIANQFEKEHAQTALTEKLSAKEMNRARLDAETSRNNMSVMAAGNSKLEAQADFEKKYEAARTQFSENEAEVYKQGDKLLLRLKGLAFANGKSDLSANSFSILSKVQTVLKDMGSGNVIVEGHTDSVGSKQKNEVLSEKRAEAVGSYLVANQVVNESNLKSEGLGDTKPIATNKTAKGRAQNRRVDIIFTPESRQ